MTIERGLDATRPHADRTRVACGVRLFLSSTVYSIYINSCHGDHLATGTCHWENKKCLFILRQTTFIVMHKHEYLYM